MAFTRTSRALPAAEVPEPFRSSLDGTGAGPILDRAQHVVETRSSQPVGFFGRLLGHPAATTSVAVLAPPWLVWSTDGGQGPVALWVALRDAEITPSEGGLTVFGPLGRSPERAQAFLGLGAEADAFRDAVVAACRQARS